MKHLVKDSVKAIKNGIDPLPVHGGLGGAYYFRNTRGESVAIVKPTDEEPFAPNNPKGFVGKALGQPGLKRSFDDGVGRFGQVELIPIDHGLCLPETLEDPYFEWIHWPQSSIPFSEDEIEYIAKLDPVEDCLMLKRELPMIRVACLRVLHLCTIFLKEAVNFGLCLAEIDCEEVDHHFAAKMTADEYMSRPVYQFGIGNGMGRSMLSKLDESIEEEEEESGGEEGEGKEERGILPSAPMKFPSISMLSASLKDTKLSDKSQKYPKFSGDKPENGYLMNSSSGHRSASEQLPSSASFVKLADMPDEEWGVFLDKVQELLCPAFEKRKSVTIGQRQRLGTSCQF
ncbi:unnamed protein product [Linum tenue]|uniref:1-phosphatidylinositol 4-kinase n=1 Tax=Linum tenue TaxID=586396 RepID=A0AAV0HZX5_9ROSI|nr:unnamed protein product [Linum tenue]CAI0462462.1 unnamed protein product [Linum tenue]